MKKSTKMSIIFLKKINSKGETKISSTGTRIHSGEIQSRQIGSKQKLHHGQVKGDMLSG